MMSVRLPDIVQLGAHKYCVKFPYHFNERSDVCAQCDNDKLELRIKDSCTGGEVRSDSHIVQSFLHELLHAIDYVFLQGRLGKLENEEGIIDGIAEGLTQAMLAYQLPTISEDHDGKIDGESAEKTPQE